MEMKRAKILNSRKVLIILSILLAVLALFFVCIKKNILSIKQNEYIVTMLGGANVEENGNLNSMGFLIQTSNNKLIVVDGGRSTDAEDLKEKINKIGNGKVDYWFLTHAHDDHIGALVKILEDEESGIEIDNLCFKFNPKEWYPKYDTDRESIAIEFFDCIENMEHKDTIKNITSCSAGETKEIDNLYCKILRVANPDIIDSPYVGNEASMVFKFSMKNEDGSLTDKSILFLGDSYLETSEELLKNNYSDLKSYAVQMAHHGQNGVSKEVYEAIDPTICFFNSPKWLYENDNGGGFNSGSWKTIEVRNWIEDPSRKTRSVSFQAFNGDVAIKIDKNGYKTIN